MLECVQGFINYFAMSYPKEKNIAFLLLLVFSCFLIQSACTAQNGKNTFFVSQLN